MKLHSYETQLIGRWFETDRGVMEDETAQRIKMLLSSHLQHIAIDSSGWDHLYADPIDGRLWELTHPESGWHGGGPPSLHVITVEAARQKYEWSPT